VVAASAWHQRSRWRVEERIGYLFLARTEATAATIETNVHLQNSLGVDSEFLDEEEIPRRWPALVGRGFRGAGFRAADGWANQQRIIDGLVRGAIAAGVDLKVGTEALGLEMSSDRITGVATTAGQIRTDAALLATGPWVAPLLDPWDLSVPVTAHRHELLIVEPAERYPERLPWLIGVDDEVHTRSDDDGRALVGGFLGEDRSVDPDRYNMRADDDWARAVLGAAERLFVSWGPRLRFDMVGQACIRRRPIVTRSSTRSPTDSTSRSASQGRASCTLRRRGDWLRS